VLVGIDTVNVAKPDPQIFLEGCRQLGTAPAATVYVGDNFMVDGVGSAQAGLQAVWLNRDGKAAPSDRDGAAGSVVTISGLTGLGVLLGLGARP